MTRTDQLNCLWPRGEARALTFITCLILGLTLKLSSAQAAPGDAPAPAKASAQAAGQKQGQKQGTGSAKDSKGAAPKVEDHSHWSAGLINIKSDLEKGEVEIGGQRVSSYPLPGPWTLSPGRYTLTLREGRWSQTRVFELKKGEVATVKIYRDPSNDPDAENIPKDFELVPETPDIEIYHPGAGFNLTTTGYILLGLSVVSLGYGIYEQAASNDRELEAQNIAESKAALRKQTFDSAASGAWRARIAFGLGAVSLVSGVTLAMFGSGGWLDSLKMKPKTGPVFGPDAALEERRDWRWGLSLSDESSSLWAHWRW